MKFENQEELIVEAERKSAEIFPGDNYDSVYFPKCGRKDWFYFSPSSYFKSNTITLDMIQRLQKGGNMLSIGPGDGNLEWLISKGFGIPRNSISVSDIKPDLNIKRYNFKSYEFDMTKPWPILNEKFDYILFPESLGVAVMHIPGDRRTWRFSDQLDPDTERIINGQDPKYPDFFIQVIEMDVPIVSKKYEIIKEAIPYLKPEGEIRIRYGLHENQQKAYVMTKLKQENSAITFPQPNEGENFTIKVP
jgi:hypothetical protein